MNILNEISPSYRSVIDMIVKECIVRDKKVYLVGGAIRDIILNVEPKDIDICIEGNPMAIIHNLKGIRNYTYFERFQTSNIIFNNGVSIDLIRCRKEFYKFNGALPQIVPSHIYDDLYRRDFTINAIAYDLINKVFVDPYNGIEDINKKCIRQIHDNSYYEDPTRIFRAIKYSSRYNFFLEDYMEIKKCLSSNPFKYISNDRFIREVLLICSEEYWESNIVAMNDFNILKLDLQKISNSIFHEFSETNTRILMLFIMINNEEDREKLINNSILKKELRVAFRNYKDLLETLNKTMRKTPYNFEVYKAFNKLNKYELDLLVLEDIFKYKIVNYKKNLKTTTLNINGEYLNNQNIKKGKQYKFVLEHVLKIKLNTGLIHERDYFERNKEEILDVTKYKD